MNVDAEQTQKKVLVIYHKGCMDGAGAAYAAWLKFGEAAEYRPAQYGDAPPTTDDVKGREVYVLDFSYKRDALLALAETADRVVLIDHHKTALEDLSPTPEHPRLLVQLDMKRSGARMAHDYFAASYRESRDELINYIQDRDLWTWALPDSREVNAALQSHGVSRDFRKLDALNVPGLRAEGTAILRYQDGVVDTLCSNAREVELDGHRVLSANAPVLQSEVAGELAKNRPFGIAWYMNREGKIIVSLRVRDGGLDVSAIAKRYGGGGHAKASGFGWPRADALPAYHDDLRVPWIIL
jgi:oligoribonuclease NrnB/cAMP/cGMP phosphodiesterase (DHH superfamily)